MIRPLKGKPYITNPFGAKGYGVFGRHAGVDYRASKGTPFYSPGDGVVTDSYNGTNGIKVLQVDIGNKSHRFLHLNDRSVKKGQKVKQGQLLGHTGDTGNVAAHLHWDIRKKGTAWNHSYSDYYDPEKLIKEEEMYKGHTAKYWYDKYQASHKNSLRRRSIIDKIKGLVGK